MSDFFIGELLVLVLLLPVVLRPFVPSLQKIRGILFLPVIALVVCVLIMAGIGFPVSFTPVFFATCFLAVNGLPRMIRALRGLAADWYSLSSRIVLGLFLPVFLGVVFASFFFAPESSYMAEGIFQTTEHSERIAAAVRANRTRWAPPDARRDTGSVIFFGDISAGSLSRATLASVLAENGYTVFADEYRSFYSWKNPLLSWPVSRFAAARFGNILAGRPLCTDEEEIHRIQRANIARTMASLAPRLPDAPVFLVAEGSAVIPAAEYVRATGLREQGLVCLVSPKTLDRVTRALDRSGFEDAYIVVASETRMVPRASAYLPVLVLSGEEGTMLGYGELDADDILAARLLGGSRDAGRKRAERLSRRITDWFDWKRHGEETLQ